MSRVFILTTQINFSSRTVANTPQTLKNQCQNIFQKFNKCKKLSTSSNFLQNFKHSPPVKPVKVKLPRRQNYQEILVEMIEAQKLQEEKELGAVEKPTSSTAPAGGAKTEGISQTNNETAAAPGRKIAQAFARIRSAEMSKREKKGLDFKGKDCPPPATVFLQVLQSGCRGVEKCVLLWSDTTSYLFNCPEGTQRMASEHKKIDKKLDHIFFTQSTWQNSGGLPGLALYLDSAGSKKITVHGPPHLRQIFQGIRPFSEETVEIEIAERHYTEPAYEDNAMTVEYIPITSALENEPDPNEKTDEPSLNELLPGDGPDFIQTVKHCMKESVKFLSVAYVCRLKKKPGSFDIFKCAELGVPKGPMLGQLQRGETVTLANGKVVTPDQVMEPSLRPPVFVVVDCPSMHFLDSLINCEKFRKFQSGEDFVDLVIHMTTAPIYRLPKYREWMQGFGPRTRHLALNITTSAYLPHYEGIFRGQGMLNHVHPGIFPNLQYYKHVSSDLPTLSNTEGVVVGGEPYLKFTLRPPLGFERDGDFVFDVASDLDSAKKENPLFQPALEAFQRKFLNRKSPTSSTKDTSAIDEARSTPELIFLGTGSATPSKYRNVSGILVNIDQNTTAMLDCGESSYFQMFHLLGPDETTRILINLKLVFISHLHQDHHLGLFTLLKKRKEAYDRMGIDFEPCCLLSPAPLFSMQQMWSRLIESVVVYSFRVSTLESDRRQKELRQLADWMGVRDVGVVKVMHPKMAAGLIIVTKLGKKIVYSGDTRPCDALVKAGRNADLLIHEGTFDDSMLAHAERKQHCTTGEAIEIGKRMGAKFTMLTHFSSRYSKLPIISDKFDDRVGVAFDNMRVSLDQLDLLPEMIPVLKEMFRTKYEENLAFVEKKKLKRMMIEDQIQSLADDNGSLIRVENPKVKKIA